MAKSPKKAGTTAKTAVPAQKVTPAPVEEKIIPLTEDQEALADSIEENDRLHDAIDENLPDGVDKVNPPQNDAINALAADDGVDINKYRESVLEYDVDETKAPFVISQDLRKDIEDFHEEHEVMPTDIRGTTVTFDKLNLRSAVANEQLNIVEEGEKDGVLILSFGKK